MKRSSCNVTLIAICATVLLTPAFAENDRQESILADLSSSAHAVVSTVPSNGDLNPYGVAFVPNGLRGGGMLVPGDILVSNFNGSSNLQGTGTTIVRIHQQSSVSVFFQGTTPPPLGLTTALGVLARGFVLVGNLPTKAGAVMGSGSLLILDRSGKMVANLMDATLLDGPWDLTINDEGDRAQVFVSNVLSGTVTRLDLAMSEDDDKPSAPVVAHMTQIASGYAHRLDPAALVIGPTGLAYDAEHDVLFVASTGDNTIFAVPNAGGTSADHGMGMLVYHDDTHLHGPLGLVLAPNGNLITANGDAVNPDPKAPNELVEFTQKGAFVAQFQVDPGAPGGAFGIAISRHGDGVRFVAVDDNTNMLNIWTVR